MQGGHGADLATGPRAAIQQIDSDETNQRRWTADTKGDVMRRQGAGRAADSNAI